MPNKIKIMIIEDEDAISNFIATTLKANAYAPLLAKTAGQALSMIPSHCNRCGQRPQRRRRSPTAPDSGC